jgi:2-methylcitrate dehydratase PrpD
MTETNLTPERAIAQLVVDFNADMIDPKSLAMTKAMIKDQFAIQIGASQLPWSKQVRKARVLRPGKSTIVADSEKVAAADAAYINASYGHGFEYDDFAGNAHPGCTVVPVAFALGEELGLPLGEVVVAMVAGFEAYVRIGNIGSPGFLNSGWQPHSVLSNFGSAAIAAKMYGLNVEQTQHALAIALSHAFGTTEYASSGGSIKRVHAGMGARNGIESADLARAGITGPRNFLTGRRGLYQNFIRETLDPKAYEIFAPDHPLMIAGINFKPYCCCACTHPFIDLMQRIVGRAQDVAEIDTSIQTMVNSIVGTANKMIYAPTNIEEVQYSLPVQMAMSALGMGNGYTAHRDILNGKTSLAPESDIIQLANKVKISIDTDLDRKYPLVFSGNVGVKYKDGSHEDFFISGAKGTPANPFTLEEHRTKLDDLCFEVIGEQQAVALYDLVDELRPDRKLGEITSLLFKP